MAPPAGTLRVGRYFAALLGIFAVLYALALWPGEKHTPRLGIDLVGGTQVIFTARAPHGKTPSSSAMDEAKSIMEDRVNGTGVTEATVVIQGTDQLVVSIPGGNATDVQKLGAAAKLNFRGVVAPAAAVTCTPGATPRSSGSSGSSAPSSHPSGSASAPSTSASASAHGFADRPLNAPAASSSTAPKPASSTSPKPASSKSSASPAPSASSSSAPAKPVPCENDPLAPALKADPTLAAALKSKDVYSKPLSASQLQLVAATLPRFNCAYGPEEPDLPNNYYIACDNGRTFGTPVAYLLGPVVVPGTQIASADAQAPNGATGQLQWSVSLTLKSKGDDAWSKYTTAHNVNRGQAGSVTQCGTTTPCADYVAFTLDGVVITAPYNNEPINGQATQITGQFSESSAKDLANKLRYGALPLTFKADTAQHVSATLGTQQLRASFIAGGIGLVLVVLYSLIYYRALGLVTIASLIVSAGMTYACLVFLGHQIGFTLDLAGVAGFIVALGITADSFVVFFERLKDEVHEGRSVRVAVPRAWVRARRTILSADTVSFLAAAILYYFAAADVKGFAFTLGLSTILDLVVVFLFTHPMLSLLSRSRAFGSARMTGLDALRGTPAAEASARARTARPAVKRAGARADRTPASAMAVLDDEERPDVGEPDVGEPELAEPGGAHTDADTETDTEAEQALAERRRTTPKAGSAAERAAARQARMRGESGEGTR
jgi:preprotein translocase subunit SecD